MFQKTVTEKIKTHILCAVSPPPRKTSRLWDNIKKYCTAGQAADDYGACALHARYLRLQTHTFGICNTYCFSTAQWLHERATVVRYTYIACLVSAFIIRHDDSDEAVGDDLVLGMRF